MLGHTDQALSAIYDLAMLDLDGVVYIGGDAVPGAPEHLHRVRSAGLRCAFVTNNASRAPATVAEHLVRLGVAAEPADVVTSAQAAAGLLADRLPDGAAVAVLGAEALVEEVRAVGLRPVGVDDGTAAAVVTGYGPDVPWRDVMRVAVRVRDGLTWVASNTDATIPTAYGVAPGHGVLVDMVRRFAGVEPQVAGKPEPPLLRETIRRVGGDRPLMIGDRLDTDIAGAHRVEVDSLLVLTGVTGLAELVAATPEERPTYVSRDLAGLGVVHPEVEQEQGAVTVGGWRATVDDDVLVCDGDGTPDDWWRAVAVAGWQHLDATGRPASVDTLAPPGG